VQRHRRPESCCIVLHGVTSAGSWAVAGVAKWRSAAGRQATTWDCRGWRGEFPGHGCWVMEVVAGGRGRIRRGRVDHARLDGCDMFHYDVRLAWAGTRGPGSRSWFALFSGGCGESSIGDRWARRCPFAVLSAEADGRCKASSRKRSDGGAQAPRGLKPAVQSPALAFIRCSSSPGQSPGRGFSRPRPAG
jgi:hypothetical protein